MSSRREFITLLGGAALAWPLAARAQQPERMRRIGVLTSGATADDPDGRVRRTAFLQGLQQLGWIDGRNIRMTYDFAEASAERLRELCAKLAQSDAVMVVTAGPQAVRALLAAGVRKPIIAAIIGDPVASGVVASLARPGGSVTGLSMNDGELEAKRLEILKEAVPGISRIAVW